MCAGRSESCEREKKDALRLEDAQLKTLCLVAVIIILFHLDRRILMTRN